METWNLADVESIMESDARLLLEMEFARLGGNIRKLFRPKDSEKKETLLHIAVRFGAFDCLSFLLNKVTSPEQLAEPDIEGRTPLHYCIEYGFIQQTSDILQCLKLLLEKGSYVNARDMFGDTAMHNVLHLQAYNSSITEKRDSNVQVVTSLFKNFKRLLQNHSQIDMEAKNASDQTPLDLEILLNVTDSIQKKTRKEKDLSNNKVIHDERAQIYSMLVTSSSSINAKKLSKKVKDNSFNSNGFIGGKSILYYIIENMEEHFAVEVLQQEVNVWIKNIDDLNLPLHAALRRGSPILTELVLQSMRKSIKPSGSGVRNLSFSLLKAVLCNNNSFGRQVKGEPNHLKCFELLLKQKDYIFLDINACCPEDKSVNALTICKFPKMAKFLHLLQRFLPRRMKHKIEGKNGIEIEILVDK